MHAFLKHETSRSFNRLNHLSKKLLNLVKEAEHCFRKANIREKNVEHISIIMAENRCNLRALLST